MSAIDGGARTWAMILHLSVFAGYVGADRRTGCSDRDLASEKK